MQNNANYSYTSYIYGLEKKPPQNSLIRKSSWSSRIIPIFCGKTSPGTFCAGLGSKAGTEISPTYGEKARKNLVFSCWDVKKLRTWWFQEQWMGIQCENDGTAWLILVRYEGEDEPNHHKFRLRSHQNVRISHGRWMKFCRVRVILAFNRQHLRTQKLLLDIPWFLAFCPSNWLSKKVS